MAKLIDKNISRKFWIISSPNATKLWKIKIAWLKVPETDPASLKLTGSELHSVLLPPYHPYSGSFFLWPIGEALLLSLGDRACFRKETSFKTLWLLETSHVCSLDPENETSNNNLLNTKIKISFVALKLSHFCFKFRHISSMRSEKLQKLNLCQL